MPSQFFGDDHDGTSSQAIFSIHGNRKSPLTAVFALDPSFWGHKGVPPHQSHPQIPLFAQTSTPNLDPFFTSSFNHNF